MEPKRIEDIVDFFTEENCPGVVALIEQLASPAGENIDSLCAEQHDLAKLMDQILLPLKGTTQARWFRIRKHSIGSEDGSTTPLEWLEKMSLIFESVPDKAKERFDQICTALLKTTELISSLNETPTVH